MTRLQLIKNIYKQHNIKLRKYQLDGIKWMLNIEEGKIKGGILADEPGLGKTYQILSLIISCPKKKPTLIIVPTGILTQWVDISKQLLGDRVCVYHTSYAHKRHFNIPSICKVVITTPGILINSSNLIRFEWRRVIFDEIQIMKNPNSRIATEILKIKAKCKWGLSGTPIQNKISDITTLFRFVTNTSNGSPLPFKLDYLIDNYLIRRKKLDVLHLPTIEIENLQIPFKTIEEKEFYDKIFNNIREEFENLDEQSLGRGEEMAILFELLLRLRQTTIHPQLVIDGYKRKSKKRNIGFRLTDWDSNIPTSKHDKLFSLIKQHPDDSTIIFCQFTKEIDILGKLAKSNGLITRRFDGSMNIHQRNKVLLECKDTNTCPQLLNKILPDSIIKHITSFIKIDILFIQIQAGGVGLNLQNFNRIYFTSPDWNPSNEIQAIARSWRFGQTKKVYVKKLILEDDKDTNKTKSIDNRILTIQQEKRNLQAKILKDESLSFNGDFSNTPLNLTRDDFRTLLT